MRSLFRTNDSAESSTIEGPRTLKVTESPSLHCRSITDLKKKRAEPPRTRPPAIEFFVPPPPNAANSTLRARKSANRARPLMIPVGEAQFFNNPKRVLVWEKGHRTGIVLCTFGPPPQRILTCLKLSHVEQPRMSVRRRD